MKHTMLFAAAAFAVAAMASTPAAAQTNERFAVRVSYADLNLNTRQGADAALGRIAFAAREGCGNSADRITLNERTLRRQCVRGSMDRAVTHLGHPVVTALYIERGGRAGSITITS